MTARRKRPPIRRCAYCKRMVACAPREFGGWKFSDHKRDGEDCPGSGVWVWQ